MPNFDINDDIEKLRQEIRELQSLRSLVTGLQAEVKALKAAKTSSVTTTTTPIVSVSGATRHGDLTGLDADDHTQYLTKGRADALYLTEAQGDARYLLRSDGLSTVATTAPITGGGTPGSETFVDGQLTAEVPAT